MIGMVEKVARAILRQQCLKRYHSSREDVIAKEIDKNWKLYIPEAKAAIAAMREPTEEMLEQATNSYGFFKIPRKAWQIMIDAALKE